MIFKNTYIYITLTLRVSRRSYTSGLMVYQCTYTTLMACMTCKGTGFFVIFNMGGHFLYEILLFKKYVCFFTDDCGLENGISCQNGACLDSQCHCNDGYGGCSCEVPGKPPITRVSVTMEEFPVHVGLTRIQYKYESKRHCTEF